MGDINGRDGEAEGNWRGLNVGGRSWGMMERGGGIGQPGNCSMGVQLLRSAAHRRSGVFCVSFVTLPCPVFAI
jgi:hypothetical protein